MTSRTRKLACISGLLLLLAVAVPVLADLWVVDHIFVSLANGTIQVYDNAGNPVNFVAGGQEILTPPSGVHYAGLDFDSTYHPYGTNGLGAEPARRVSRFWIRTRRSSVSREAEACRASESCTTGWGIFL